MAVDHHYPNAPITEAVIDIRVELPPTVALADIERLDKKLPDYPKKNRRIELTLMVEPSVSRQEQRLNGYVFRSMDGKQIVQMRMDGFTFSRLPPYDRWETFSVEAKRLWTIYRCGVEPLKITRLAVRYINRIDMPQPVDDFGKYLNAIPQSSVDFFKNVTGFFLQLQIPQNDIKSMLLFNEAIAPPPTEKVLSVLLDFDLSRTDNVPQDEREIWRVFEAFRSRKNELFEACITDASRSLFQ